MSYRVDELTCFLLSDRWQIQKATGFHLMGCLRDPSSQRQNVAVGTWAGVGTIEQNISSMDERHIL